MKLRHWTAAAALAAAAFAAPAHADTAQLKLVSPGGMMLMGGYMPQPIKLTGEKPASLTKAPDGLKAPKYGQLTVTINGKATPVNILVDDLGNGATKLFVDSNANGDLTDDEAAKWDARPYAAMVAVKPGEKPAPPKANLTQHMGGASIQSGDDKLHFGMYAFDNNDPSRAALKDTVFFYPDFAFTGDVTIGGKAYKAVLFDRTGANDFATPGKGVGLMVDFSGDGKFMPEYAGYGETVSFGKPFKWDNKSYVITAGAKAGALSIEPSKEDGVAIKLPPDLTAGHQALAFDVKSTSGKDISFPKTYKGRLVMLDFWATWCGPCKAELPNLVANYNKYHAKGFDVLGISLDQPKMEEKLATFTKDNNMPWEQVYDGGFWKAKIAQQYVIMAIPAAILVDGDTGKIVASGNDMRGEKLGPTLEKALAAKNSAMNTGAGHSAQASAK